MSPKKTPLSGRLTVAKAAGERQPKSVFRSEGNDRKLIFSFQYVDRAFDGMWSWPVDGSPDAWEILDFLCDASRVDLGRDPVTGDRTGEEAS